MLKLLVKGFAMGVADIVPGVSGGTIAFITGIYSTLIESISSVNVLFLKKILNFKFQEAYGHINGAFLVPLLIGILIAIISMSRLMHFLMTSYQVYTWSFFFGLVAVSIIYIMKQIKSFKSVKNICFIFFGCALGVVIVSLVPVETSDSNLFIFISGMIAICAMILPGISGSFLLLILGKYASVTGALKSPFLASNLEIIIVFAMGCLLGILSFSKVLNFLLRKHQAVMMSFLTGFMLGSLKKIWPWKQTLETQVIRGKSYILREANTLPSEMSQEAIFSILLVITGFSIIFIVESISNKKGI